MERRRCTVIGDRGVGKTCLLTSIIYNSYPEEYVPTILNKCSVFCVDEKQNIMIQMSFNDTSDWPEYLAFRHAIYAETDILILAFSIASPSTLRNLQKKWIQEVKEFSPRTPFIMVGTKCDLRYSVEESVSSYEGQAFAEHLGASAYLECSSLQKIGIDLVLRSLTIQLEAQTIPKDLISCDQESSVASRKYSKKHFLKLFLRRYSCTK